MPATSRILDSEIPRASVTGPNTRHRPLHSRIGVPVPSDCAGRLRPCATTTTNWGYLSKVHTHNAKYEQGVAVFTLPKSGAMVAAAVGGQKFKFEPIKQP